MKKYFPLLLAILIAGCSLPARLSSAGTGKDVSKKKLTMREIDSLTAQMNYNFTSRNIIEAD